MLHDNISESDGVGGWEKKKKKSEKIHHTRVKY